MPFYVKSLFIAIPSFIVLIIIEMIFAKLKGLKVNNHADMISSLSSGMTNIIKDSLKFTFVIISYVWLVDNITIYKLEPLWLAIIIAFIIQDFTGYWMHRLSHRVNLFWNRHIIHHSSEEFNLSCALRQSISTTFEFSAILMIPAAFLGIPWNIFAVLGPIHLFMQFWYHTRVIDKMGVLEYILVTPSHHRVHHAINPEYIDKNYSQIFIIWDKLFNTFQPEIKEIKPVYGTLRPALTWNPIIINFKHLGHLIKDAWYADKFIDKIRIWFMPTGWRPESVKSKFPLSQVDNPNMQIKYKKNNSFFLLIWSWSQHIIAGAMLFHFFTVLGYENILFNNLYASFLLLHIFALTSLLDHSKYSIAAEVLKVILACLIFYFYNNTWFDIKGIFVVIFQIYLLCSLLLSINFYLNRNKSLIT
tara:strand:+ start:70 stop:1320 length:1251 start_codon:yes stop_codon:yes gene_type:complete